MRLFGVKLESEHIMCQQILTQLPNNFIIEKVPFRSRNGDIHTAPIMATSDLVKLAFFYLEEYEKHGLLTWHGTLNTDEIPIKGGGGIIGFQVANLETPNS